MKQTAVTFRQAKGQRKLAMLTAYDATVARLMDDHVDAVLVGDSLGMVMLGQPDTLSVTMDQMIHHSAAVSRGLTKPLLVCDMPFMSYHLSPQQACANAGRLVQEGRAQAVKLEGGRHFCPQVEAIVQASIPVMGHLGLTPQSLHSMGGYKVQGRGREAAQALLDDARALEQAGVFAIVLECVPAPLAALVSRSVSVPTIGIGAGPDCDGQVLVWQDMPSGGGQYNLLTISAPLITGIHLKDSHYRLFARTDAQGREDFTRELTELITQLQNCPCIVLWVPFNEGWGQFDAKNAVRLIRRLDPTRLIDHASGWHDQGVSDVKSLHVYFKPYRFKPDKKGRAVVLSEFGGYNLPVAGHTWNAKNFGYKGYQTPEALGEAVKTLYETQIVPACKSGLAADVYTQLSDVEDEVNGFVTYDRRVEKLPEALMRAIARELKGD